MSFVDIILPLVGPSFYTYRIDNELAGRLKRGAAVAVPFGARQIVGGIVREVHDRRPAFATKAVSRLLFAEPIVSESQLRLWEWIAEYYMASAGEVMRAALPAMLKPKGFSEDEFASEEFRPRRVKVVGLAPALADESAFNAACAALKRAPKQYNALVDLAARLLAAGEIPLLPEGGVPPLAGGGVVGLLRSRSDLFIPRSDLNADPTILNALAKKGLIVINDVDPSPQATPLLQEGGVPTLAVGGVVGLLGNLPTLSQPQQTALNKLRAALTTHQTALLFGVPSSGKSEVYFHSIARALAHGRDVLLLLPEIALTTQFVGRVQKIFGDRVVLYHSGLSDRRRAEAYIRLARSGGGSLIVGTRSAIFLPMPRLGLVVVDEEQDSGYKQQDPAPRYNARDTAIVLANLNDARVILVSATPSLETWANATSGKYGLVTLTERWGGTHPPEVVISDTLRAVKRGERRGHINKELSDAISAALTRGEQVILFQNRRGVAPFIECTDCGHVPGCDHCGIPMTVHRGTLRCHYCGAVTPAPSLCPSCGGMNLTTRGFGTEKIEEELARIFPAARIARLDRDSASSERAYRRIIDDFEAGATDILVGTQMITKGLDFAGVTLVGVLNADNLAAHPDFRASERAYALIAQVAGRAGRHAAPLAKAEIPPAAGVDSAQTPLLQEGGVPPLAGGGVVGLSLAAGEIPLHAKEGWRPKGDGVVDTPPRGRVIIQTASPDNPLISKAAAGDYRAMASELLAERSMYGYPPFTRLVSIMLRHPDRDTLAAAAQKFKELLETKNSECDLHSELLGPQPPIVEKIKGEFALIFLVKIPKTDPLTVTRVAIRRSVETLAIDHAWRRVSVTVNVDPI